MTALRRSTSVWRLSRPRSSSYRSRLAPPAISTEASTATRRIVTDLGAADYAFDVAVQRDGKIVVVGRELPDGRISRFWIARYTAAGALDRSFGSGGIIRPDFGSTGSGNAVIVKRTARSW